MKKSNLKYFFLSILLGTIYSLYHYNKKYFESPNSPFKKNNNSVFVNSNNNLSYSSGGSDISSFNLHDVPTHSNSIGVEIENSNLDGDFAGANSTNNSGFSSNQNTFSSVSQNSQNSNDYYDEVENNSSTSSNLNQSTNSEASSGVAISAISINIPVTTDKRKEEEKKSKRESTTQVSAKRSFFESVAASGVDMPMSPCPPGDCPVPLDGGASMLFIIGSLLGIKKLFLKKAIVS